LAAPGQDWMDPAEARPAPTAQEWLDPAEARPGAPQGRTDQAPGEPFRPAATGPDEAAQSPAPDPGDDPAQPTAPGQDETDQPPAARPFAIRSLDDNPVAAGPAPGRPPPGRTGTR
jgi:hypothetical protein